MALLAAKAYNPTTAVSKSTATAIAMTAFDTTNLRVTFNAPANGMVLVRIAGTIHGATTTPGVLLGVMSGATVLSSFAPATMWAGAQAATSLVGAEATWPVVGLTPGAAQTWDAAYSVETVVASSAIKYGGPNTATANDGFGALVFEVWSTS